MSFAARAIPLYGSDPYPNASVALDFVRGYFKAPGASGGSLSAIPGWTYSRTGTEYASTSSGLLVPFGSGVPAITDLGLQVWEARTNLLTWSRDLTNAAWAKRGTAIATASTIASPDGTVAGTLLSGIGVAATNDVFALPTTAIVANARVELSFWINKVSSSGTLTILNSQNATLGSWSINLANVPAGWQRITRSHAAVTINIEFTATAAGFAGLQFTATAGAPLSFYVDLSQLEAGTFSGPPVVTTTASATRGAASASVGGLSLPSAFTVLTEYNRTSAAQNGGVMRTAPVAVGTYVAVDAQDNNTTGWWASGLEMSGSIVGVNKTALAVNSSGTARASRNGGAVVSSSANDYVGGATSIQLGINRATGVYLNDYLRRVVIYPGILPDAQLQAITS